MYAAGKIPGGFIKREGRAGEKAILTARLIDRPIRPLVPEGLAQRDPDRRDPAVGRPGQPVRHPRDERRLRRADGVGHPVRRPVGAVRVGKIDGDFVVNPDEEELLETSDLDLVVAGTEDAILMVEAGANEVSEAEILDALNIAHDAIKKLLRGRSDELPRQAGKAEGRVDPAVIDAELCRSASTDRAPTS